MCLSVGALVRFGERCGAREYHINRISMVSIVVCELVH